MKPLKVVKTALRLWIATTATGSFLAGWALFAHAPKPVQSSAGANFVAAPLPTLAPLPPLDISGTSGGGRRRIFQQGGCGSGQLKHPAVEGGRCKPCCPVTAAATAAASCTIPGPRSTISVA